VAHGERSKNLSRKAFPDSNAQDTREGGDVMRNVLTLHISELEKAEAGLTCMSIIFS
jgi:hypothetical protein